MDRRSLSERDICTKFITPALRNAGWDEMLPRIVAKLGELMALCDQLESARATRETARDRLLAALLHQALHDEALGPAAEELEAAG